MSSHCYIAIESCGCVTGIEENLSLAKRITAVIADSDCV